MRKWRPRSHESTTGMLALDQSTRIEVPDPAFSSAGKLNRTRKLTDEQILATVKQLEAGWPGTRWWRELRVSTYYDLLPAGQVRRKVVERSDVAPASGRRAQQPRATGGRSLSRFARLAEGFAHRQSTEIPRDRFRRISSRGMANGNSAGTPA
jgi:hypothetical protein